MTDSKTTNNRNTNYDLESLASDVKLHIITSLDILRNKYHLKEEKENILYYNIQKIVDTAIIKYTLPQKDDKIVGYLWGAIASEYLQDTVRAFEKKPNRIINRTTDELAQGYLEDMLVFYKLEEPDFPTDPYEFGKDYNN
jgi:hypothetical protein